MTFQRMRTIRMARRLGGRLRQWLHGDSAATATEYAVMLALIILVAVGSINMIGEKFFNLYTMIANAVGETI
jgi:Flp pilus assembly pilin Flp